MRQLASVGGARPDTPYPRERATASGGPGIRQVAFAVEDIDAIVAGLRKPAALNSSASWSATRTATGSATSGVPEGIIID